jgi:hypothetical protein
MELRWGDFRSLVPAFQAHAQQLGAQFPCGLGAQISTTYSPVGTTLGRRARS